MIGANGITDGVHIRMMVTRGVRRSPYQDPRLAIGGATVVIIPEWKRPRPEMLARGVRLFTVHIRRTRPTELDQKLKSHSTLNCILACIHAMEAGADEALMLDDRGFVASCNSTHFFIVRKGELWTSAGGYCLGGIAPGTVLQAARRKGVPAFEKDFSLCVRRLWRRRRLHHRHIRGPCSGRVRGRPADRGYHRRGRRPLRSHDPPPEGCGQIARR